MNFILIQIVGAIGYILLSSSYYRKEKRNILIMQIFAYIFFSIHFFLLNGITGAICNLMGMCALIAIYFFDKSKLKNIVGIIFMGIIIAVNIITYQNIFSIFPMIASVIAIGSFLTKKENTIRAIGIISTMLWLIYAIAYKSYISIVFQVGTLIGVIIAFIKNKKK